MLDDDEFDTPSHVNAPPSTEKPDAWASEFEGFGEWSDDDDDGMMDFQSGFGGKSVMSKGTTTVTHRRSKETRGGRGGHASGGGDLTNE